MTYHRPIDPLDDTVDPARDTSSDPPADPAALAPVLGARKDGSVGADSGGDLLMTVLGEFVLPHGDGAWTQTLLELMERLDLRGKATRQALSRMEQRGWLERRRSGRRTRWSLTDTSRRLLEAGAERIYGFGRDRRAWDGRWSLVLASVPERDRNARHRMATGLSWAGYASLAPGVWISPWADHDRSAADVLTRSGVDASTFRAELGALGSGPDLVARAWDLDALHTAYVAFLDDTDALTPPTDGLDAAARLARLVHRWRRFPFLDPDLPAELLPQDWPARTAAERFADRRDALVPYARSWWTATDAGFST